MRTAMARTGVRSEPAASSSSVHVSPGPAECQLRAFHKRPRDGSNERGTLSSSRPTVVPATRALSATRCAAAVTGKE